MTTKAKVYRASRDLGAEVRVLSGALLDVEIVAPVGKHWDGGVHALVRAQEDGEPRADVWADLLERMGDGLWPCHTGCSESQS